MKKILVLALALCLAVPAMSYAGNATSRFDLNIGGVVKVDVGWSDTTTGTLQAGGSLVNRDPRNDDLIANANRKYGSQLWGAGETGINFLIRGPEAFGAKTSAFINTDFTGVWGSSNYNTNNLVIATINLDWANTSFTIGQSPQVWGKLPTWSQQLAWGGQNLGTKGSAPNMINAIVTQRFAKAWTVKYGISSVNGSGSANNFPAPSGTPQYVRSELPLFQAAVNWSSGACGKVGPWQLTFGTSGVWGREKIVFNDGTGLSDDDDVDMWLADFRFLVPIIPEKNGNKAGALYVDGAASYSQNAGAFIGPLGGVGGANLKYDRNATGVQANVSSDPNWSAPPIFGWVGHIGYYFTDKISMNGFYGVGSIASSHQAKARFQGLPENSTQYAISLIYDVNPALRFGLHYDHVKTKYDDNAAAAAAGLTNHGTISDYRFAAYYFF